MTGNCEAILAEDLLSFAQDGVLISASGPSANTLKIRPPLPFGRAEATNLLDLLDD
jgi:4-aminobutyrate aminotransferase-like enzyme